MYFQEGRSTSTKQLLICAGFGRTGTETLNSIVSGSHLGIHEKKPVTLLPSLEDDAFAGILDKFEEDKIALLDNPVGLFAWELMDAFPRHFVVLTARHVSRPDACLRMRSCLRCLQRAACGRCVSIDGDVWACVAGGSCASVGMAVSQGLR